MRIFVTEQEVRRMVAEALTKRFGVAVRFMQLEVDVVPGPEGECIFNGFSTDDIPLSGDAPAPRPAPEKAKAWPGERLHEPVTIAGVNYLVHLIDGGRRALVSKGTEETYVCEWTLDPLKALAKGGNLHGYQCTCGDFVHRHAGEKGDGQPCKHLARLFAIGLLPSGPGPEADEEAAAQRVLDRLGWNTSADASLVS